MGVTERTSPVLVASNIGCANEADTVVSGEANARSRRMYICMSEDAAMDIEAYLTQFCEVSGDASLI